MDGSAAPETEVPEVEVGYEGAPAAADEAGDATQPKGGKKKRTWQKVNSLYNPAPYTSQKGASKGGKGGGKGGKGGPDGEGSPKGKGKGKDIYSEAEPQKMQEDPGKVPAGAEVQGPGSMDGDAMQAKGAGARSKKQGGKSREGKGKGAGGKAPPAAQRKGCGGPGAGPGMAPGPGPGAGPGAGPCVGPGPGPALGAKGMPRGGAMPSEAPEPGSEAPEGPRPPGPQRAPMPGKGGAGQGGMPGVPVAMAPYGYGAAVPYPCGAAVPYPYGPGPAVYAMPYYVMPSPTASLNTGSSPYMPGAGGPPQPQPNSADRQNLKGQVQQQIEYYFGRENMIKDVYLRSRLMNEEGWVQIAPLANFRRVQSMTTDMAVIMDAIASSQKLEMDPQGQHVRLKNNWQEWVLPNQGGRSPASPAAPAAPAAAPAASAAPAPGPGARGA